MYIFYNNMKSQLTDKMSVAGPILSILIYSSQSEKQYEWNILTARTTLSF